jgi:phytoene synthase
MTDSPDPQTLRYLIWLYGAPLERAPLAALCALEREIASSLHAGMDHLVAHTRLAWWREECLRCAAGNPQHPLTRELLAALAARGRGPGTLAAAGLSGLVENAAWDLAAATFETRAELEAYCRRWAAAMIAPLAPPDAAPGAAPAGTWLDLGGAVRETELLSELAPAAARGRVRLPLDELDARGVPLASLARPPWPEALCRLLRERVRALRPALARAVAQVPPALQPGTRGALVWAALASQVARRLERALPHPARPSGASAFASSWRAWRAARAAMAQRLRLP